MPTVVRTLAAVVLGSALLGGCTDPLVSELEGTGLSLYLPTLAGRLPVVGDDGPEPGVRDMEPVPSPTGPPPEETAVPTSVTVREGDVVVGYERDGRAAYELLLTSVPEGDLCRAVPQVADSQCSERPGVMTSVMEEQASVAVVRGETMLVLRGLVVESHPRALTTAVRILQQTPSVSAQELAEVD